MTNEKGYSSRLRKRIHHLRIDGDLMANARWNVVACIRNEHHSFQSRE